MSNEKESQSVGEKIGGNEIISLFFIIIVGIKE
jgi:hypothetical protein